MEYKNHFANLPDADRVRTTVELPTTIKSVINKYDSRQGVLQIAFSVLFTKLTNELAKSNLTAGDYDKYRHAVANCVITLPVEYYDTKPGGADSEQRVPAPKSATRPKRNSTKQAVG